MSGEGQTIESLTLQLSDLKTQMGMGHTRIERKLAEMLSEQKYTNGRVTGLEQREAALKAVREYAEANGRSHVGWTQWGISLLIGLLGSLLAVWLHH